jgi:hypothetical protein
MVNFDLESLELVAIEQNQGLIKVGVNETSGSEVETEDSDCSTATDNEDCETVNKIDSLKLNDDEAINSKKNKPLIVELN